MTSTQSVSRSSGLSGLETGVVGIERARREAVGLGQHDRQHLVGQRVRVAVDVVDDRERLAPVALAAEQPVAQLVGDRRLAVAVRLEPRVGSGDAVGLVAMPSRSSVSLDELTYGASPMYASATSRCRAWLDGRPAANHAVGGRWMAGIEPELAGELEVALVAARHRHDRAGAVAHQHVVGDPDRDLGAVSGLMAYAPVNTPVFSRVSSVRSISFFVAAWRRYAATALGLLGRGERVDERVLGREHHERRAEQRVGAGGEHGDVAGGDCEVHVGARRAADPVALHRLDRRRSSRAVRGRR